MDDITTSILGLAKNNNGFFKSEKQASFLISKIEAYQNCIGHSDSGFNSCPLFAEYDNKGITKITKHGKNGITILFERKVNGIMTAKEVKEIKSLKRRLKAEETDLHERIVSFDSGNYNGSGDKNSYDETLISTYHRRNAQKEELILQLKNKLASLEGYFLQ